MRQTVSWQEKIRLPDEGLDKAQDVGQGARRWTRRKALDKAQVAGQETNNCLQFSISPRRQNHHFKVFQLQLTFANSKFPLQIFNQLH